MKPLPDSTGYEYESAERRVASIAKMAGLREKIDAYRASCKKSYGKIFKTETVATGKIVYPASELKAADEWMRKHGHKLPKDSAGRDGDIEPYANFFDGTQNFWTSESDDLDGIDYAAVARKQVRDNRTETEVFEDPNAKPAEDGEAENDAKNDIERARPDLVDPVVIDRTTDTTSGSLGSGWRLIEHRLIYGRESLAETLFHKPMNELTPDEFLNLERGILKTGRLMRKSKKHQSRTAYTLSPLRTADADRKAALEAATKELTEPSVVAVPLPKNPYSAITIQSFDAITQNFVEGIRLRIEDADNVRRATRNKDKGFFSAVAQEVTSRKFKKVRDCRNTVLPIVPPVFGGTSSTPAPRPHPFRQPPPKVACSCAGCTFLSVTIHTESIPQPVLVEV